MPTGCELLCFQTSKAVEKYQSQSRWILRKVVKIFGELVIKVGNGGSIPSLFQDNLASLGLVPDLPLDCQLADKLSYSHLSWSRRWNLCCILRCCPQAVELKSLLMLPIMTTTFTVGFCHTSLCVPCESVALLVVDVDLRRRRRLFLDLHRCLALLECWLARAAGGIVRFAYDARACVLACVFTILADCRHETHCWSIISVEIVLLISWRQWYPHFFVIDSQLHFRWFLVQFDWDPLSIREVYSRFFDFQRIILHRLAIHIIHSSLQYTATTFHYLDEILLWNWFLRWSSCLLCAWLVEVWAVFVDWAISYGARLCVQQLWRACRGRLRVRWCWIIC